MPLFLFCLKELRFSFIIPICTCINSVRKMLGNQIDFTPSIKVIPLSKYLSFHLGVVLGHANWASLILTSEWQWANCDVDRVILTVLPWIDNRGLLL